MTKPSIAIAISSRALFDAEDGHAVFAHTGTGAFMAEEAAHTREPLAPGLGFPIVSRIARWGEKHGIDVRVVVISRRDPASGARILRSLSHHGLTKAQGSFLNGPADLAPYLSAFGAHLFLSRDPVDVQAAIDGGVPAALIDGVPVSIADDELIRIGFDGDAVLFSAQSEQFYQTHGLEAFLDREHAQVDVALPPGPMIPFLQALSAAEAAAGERLTRTALVTSRQGLASERAIRSLEKFGVHVDEAHYCGPTPKAGVLRAFRAHLLVDDQARHLDAAAGFLVTAQVPWMTAPEDAAGTPPSPRR